MLFFRRLGCKIRLPRPEDDVPFSDLKVQSVAMHSFGDATDSTSSLFCKGLVGVRKAANEMREAVAQGARRRPATLRL